MRKEPASSGEINSEAASGFCERVLLSKANSDGSLEGERRLELLFCEVARAALCFRNANTLCEELSLCSVLCVVTRFGLLYAAL